MQVEAGVLFVDLDETILDGTVNSLSDEELRNRPLHPATMHLLIRAQMLGMPIIMVTRNDEALYERFFNAFPQMRMLFTEVYGGNFSKSGPIESVLRRYNLEAHQAIFIDDTGTERSDVENNTGVLSIHPRDCHQVSFAPLSKERLVENIRKKTTKTTKIERDAERLANVRYRTESLMHQSL